MVVLLEAFGSRTFFRDAYKYTLPEIYEWLERASMGETGGPSALIPEVQDDLRLAYKTIKGLSLPDGRYYNGTPDIRPKEHFRRKKNSTWPGASRERGSKFILMEQRGFQRRDARGNPIPVSYWSPYDLLGYFLSRLGPAPNGANRNNYFLPLTAVYARWCSKIAGHCPADNSRTHGAGDWPYMFQCTWYKEENSARIPFGLGASLAGSDWRGFRTRNWPDEDVVGPGWRARVGYRRFQVLSDNAAITQLTQDDWDKETGPATNSKGIKTPWGNCAELYPFMEQMRDDKTLNETNLYGLALSRNFLKYGDDEYDDRPAGRIWRCVCGPCDNCRALLKKAGANQYHFDQKLERWRAMGPLQPRPLDVAAQAAAEEQAAPSIASVADSKDRGPVGPSKVMVEM